MRCWVSNEEESDRFWGEGDSLLLELDESCLYNNKNSIELHSQNMCVTVQIRVLTKLATDKLQV